MALTAELAKKYKEIILALGEGKEIQYKIKDISKYWKTTIELNFPLDTEYRIKPEPRKIYVTFDEFKEIGYCDMQKPGSTHIHGNKVIPFIEQMSE